MKLAELLIARKAEKANLTFLENRLKSNAKVQEGEAPQENPVLILSKIRLSVVKIEEYTIKINKTNAETPWPDGGTLANALARRDSLAKLRRILSDALDALTVKEPRFGRMEIKYIPVLDATSILDEIDTVTKAYAALEMEIQKLNWTVTV